MLKIAVDPEEKCGAGLVVWWNGIGAARVLEHDDDIHELSPGHKRHHRRFEGRRLITQERGPENVAICTMSCAAALGVFRQTIGKLASLGSAAS